VSRHDAPWALYRESHRLDHRLLTHAGIHQATGMVLAQLDISATEALARMRAHAFAEHRMLIEVANDVLSRQLRFTNAML